MSNGKMWRYSYFDFLMHKKNQIRRMRLVVQEESVTNCCLSFDNSTCRPVHQAHKFVTHLARFRMNFGNFRDPATMHKLLVLGLVMSKKLWTCMYKQRKAVRTTRNSSAATVSFTLQSDSFYSSNHKTLFGIKSNIVLFVIMTNDSQSRQSKKT